MCADVDGGLSMSRFIDLTGNKYGRLLILEKSEKTDSSYNSYWVCKCDCGNTRILSGYNLKSGNTSSCGCYLKEQSAIRIKSQHGKGYGKKHGEYNTRLYRTWAGIKNRCLNPNSTGYENWGGRGIELCNEWYKFEPFRDWALANGYSDKLTIDRKNNNLNYTPDNCRWATVKQQNNNQSSNLYYEINGERHTLHEWSELLGFGYSAVYARIKQGVDPVDAMTYKGRMKIKKYLKSVNYNDV